MKISMIVALDQNNAIGSKNQLVWHLPDDFKWFKQQTMGKPMIMGRNTMLSLGKPLPKRQNIVISSKPDHILEGFEYAPNLEEALKLIAKETEEVFIIGGGQVYASLLDKTDCLYITRIHHAFEDMDTFFPKWSEEEWHRTFSQNHAADDRHAYSFDFEIYERI
jgi:dihydrofolate reductase